MLSYADMINDIMYNSVPQFRMVSMRSEKPMRAPTHLSGVSPMLPLKQLQFQCWSDWQSRKIVERFLFLLLFPPGDRWCDFLGFVPAGSVSSSSTLQSFRDASHSWWLICPPVYLLCHLLWLRHAHSTPIGIFEGGCRTLTHASLGFPIHFLLFVAGSLNLWEWWQLWSDRHLSRQSSIVKLA